MAEEEKEGYLILQRDKLIWKSIPKIAMSNVQRLKKFDDDEMWGDEIDKIEK